jgi:hypothetical protein
MRYAVLLAGAGFLLSILLFFGAPIFVGFIVPLALATVLLFLSGLWIDRSRKWYAWITVLFVLGSMFLYWVVLNANTLCMCVHVPYENVFTGRCDLDCAACNGPAWYWMRTDRCDERFEELVDAWLVEQCGTRTSLEFEICRVSYDPLFERQRSILNNPSE